MSNHARKVTYTHNKLKEQWSNFISVAKLDLIGLVVDNVYEAFGLKGGVVSCNTFCLVAIFNKIVCS